MQSRDDQLRQLIIEQAAEWHVAQAEHPLDPEQARQFMHWLRASPRHVAEYLAIADVDGAVQEVARQDATPLADLLRAGDGASRLVRLRAAMPQPARVGRPLGATPRPGLRRLRWARAAGAVVVLAILAVASWWMRAPLPFTEVVATQRGQTLNVLLPDRTSMQVDAESSVRVDFGRWRREVVLERGRAYFKVHDDAGRPFIVRGGPLIIRDVGTAFDVLRRGSCTAVTVANGRVAVWSHSLHAGGDRSAAARTGPRAPIAELTGGQRLQAFDDGRVVRSSVNLWDALAWTDGRITFDDVPVAAVVSEFNRHNRVQIRVASAPVDATRISGTFEATDVPAFVAFLKTLPGVVVHADGNVVSVRPAASTD